MSAQVQEGFVQLDDLMVPLTECDNESPCNVGEVEELKFTGSLKVEQFINKASAIVSLARTIRKESKVELAPTIGDIIGKLDDEVRNSTLSESNQ